MLRVSRAETTEGRLENVQKLIQFAGSFTGALSEWRHASSEEQKKVLASSSRNMSCHGHRPRRKGMSLRFRAVRAPLPPCRPHGGMIGQA